MRGIVFLWCVLFGSTAFAQVCDVHGRCENPPLWSGADATECSEGSCSAGALSAGVLVGAPQFPVIREAIQTSIQAPVVVATKVASVPVGVTRQVAIRTRSAVRRVRSRKPIRFVVARARMAGVCLFNRIRSK